MNKTWRRLSIGVGVVLVTVVAGVAGASVKANARLSRHFETHELSLPLPDDDAETIARGEHLAVRYGCTGCHGADLAGGVMIDDPAIGTVRGPNLTSGRGGRVEGYTMTDWDRIVRHGVMPDGKPSLMPSQDFFEMADEELLDIVAYIRSRPAVDAEVPRPELGLVGRVLIATGQLALSAEAGAATTQHRTRPPEAADTVEFGAHVAATCVGCHRAGFEGGPMPFGPPSWPQAANLTRDASGLAAWTFEEFDRALTQGVAKDGRQLAVPMSEVIAGTRAMLPIERRALWTYLQSLPPTPTGQ